MPVLPDKTPAHYGFDSTLYSYMDNFLDNPEIDIKDKEKFNH